MYIKLSKRPHTHKQTGCWHSPGTTQTAYIHTHAHTYTHTQIHTGTHILTYTHTNSSTPSKSKSIPSTYAQTHTYTHTHIHTHTHTHTHTRTHTNTRTHILDPFSFCPIAPSGLILTVKYVQLALNVINTALAPPSVFKTNTIP